ncbi:hypothetical protein L0F63_005493 [Massospora cicadina]|nr:hypothetical protein L0F63_005493 [Massospora cicadina]
MGWYGMGKFGHDTSTARRWAICFGLGLIYFACALDETMMATTIADIGKSLGGEGLVGWTSRIYMLFSTACQLLYGRASDVFGRRRVLLAVLIQFGLGSSMQVAAQNMWTIIVARGIMGIGVPGMVSIPYMVIADLMPIEERGPYFGVLGSVYALSNVAGAILGGAIAASVSWRWMFSISLLAAFLGLVVIVALVPKDCNLTMSSVTTLDGCGMLLLVLGLLMLVLGLNWGGQVYPWVSAQVLATLMVGLGLLSIFMWYEARTLTPILPLRIFNRNVLLISLVDFTVGYSFYVLMYMWPTFQTDVHHTLSTSAGLHLVPLLMGVSIASLASSKLMYFGYSIVIRSGVGLILFGTGMLFRMRLVASVEEKLYTLVVGFGVGLGIQALLLALLASVSTSDIPIASTLSAFALTIGGIIGLAIHASIKDNFINGILQTNTHTTITDQLYLNAYKTTFLAMIPFITVGLVATLFIRQKPTRSPTTWWLERQ